MNMKPASQEHILKKPSSKKAKESKLAKAVKKTLLKKPNSKESKTDQIWKKVYVSQSHVNDIRAEITGLENNSKTGKKIHIVTLHKHNWGKTYLEDAIWLKEGMIAQN